MTMTCFEATELTLGATGVRADQRAAGLAAAHVAQCARCGAALAGQRALADSLRAVAPPRDERARRSALARLGPALDRIDARRAHPWWRTLAWATLPAIAAAAAIAWWLRAGPAAPLAVGLAPPPPAAAVAPPTPAPLPTLTPAPTPAPMPAFPVIVLGPGEHRDVALDADPRTHAEVIGPGRIEIVHAAPSGLELAIADATVIGEAGDAPLWVRGGGTTIRAQRARFAASMRGAASVVVERGVIDLDRRRLRAGQWQNRDDRAPALRRSLGAAPTASTATAATAAPPAPAAVTAAAASPSAAPRVAMGTAGDMYAAAEAALDRGDHAGALLRLRTLVEEFPDAPQRATALYELATHAHRAGDLAEARTWLAMLTAGHPPAGLAKLAAYLACRIDLDAGDRAAARRCFATFAATYPSSPHADDARTWGTTAPEAP